MLNRWLAYWRFTSSDETVPKVLPESIPGLEPPPDPPLDPDPGDVALPPDEFSGTATGGANLSRHSCAPVCGLIQKLAQVCAVTLKLLNATTNALTNTTADRYPIALLTFFMGSKQVIRAV
jgi:hypothetical protein